MNRVARIVAVTLTVLLGSTWIQGEAAAQRVAPAQQQDGYCADCMIVFYPDQGAVVCSLVVGVQGFTGCWSNNVYCVTNNIQCHVADARGVGDVAPDGALFRSEWSRPSMPLCPGLAVIDPGDVISGGRAALEAPSDISL